MKKVQKPTSGDKKSLPLLAGAITIHSSAGALLVNSKGKKKMTRWKRAEVEYVYTLHAHNSRSLYLDALENALRLHDVPAYWQSWQNHDGSWSQSLTVCAEAWSRRREKVLESQDAIHAEMMAR